MAYEALQNLVPSTRGNGTDALVPVWLAAIESDGYAQVPVYHNVKKVDGEVKSMVVRKKLEKLFSKLYFIHAKGDGEQTFLIVSNKQAVFKAMKWDFQTHEREVVE